MSCSAPRAIGAVVTLIALADASPGHEASAVLQSKLFVEDVATLAMGVEGDVVEEEAAKADHTKEKTATIWALPVGATASACTTHGNQVSDGIDGNLNTGWGCCSADVGIHGGQNYTIDLKRSLLVSGAQIVFSCTKAWTILVSEDGHHFLQVGSYHGSGAENPGVEETKTWGARLGRFLRIHMYQSCYGTCHGITEVKLQTAVPPIGYPFFLAEGGKSCTAACQAKAKTCDAKRLSQAALSWQTCKSVIESLGKTPTTGGQYDDDRSGCTYYPDPAGGFFQLNKLSGDAECDVVNADNARQRVCACSGA